MGTSTDNIDAQTNSILDFWQKFQKNEIKVEVNLKKKHSAKLLLYLNKFSLRLKKLLKIQYRPKKL